MSALISLLLQAWQRIGKEAAWVFLAQLLVMLANILALRQLTELLPTAEYGRAYLFINAIGFGLLVFIAPFSQAANRFYHEDQRLLSLDALLGLVWRCQIVLSIACGGAYLVFCLMQGYLTAPYAVAYGLVPVYFTFAGLQQITIGLLNISRRRAVYASLQIADAWLRPSLALLLGWYWRADANAILLGFGLATLITGSVSGVLLMQMGTRLPYRLPWPQAEQIRQITHYGLPFVALSMASWVMALSDRYLVTWLLGFEETGRYMAGYQVGSQVFLFAGGMFGVLSQPFLFQDSHPTLDQRGRIFSEWGQLFVWLTMPVLVGFFLIKDWLMRWLVAPAYWDAAPILGWVGLGNYCLILANFAATIFLVTKQPQKMMRYYAYAAVVNIGCNLVLIPHFGIEGAAMATFLAYAVYALQCVQGGRRELPWRFPWRTFFWAGAGVSLAGCITHSMSSNIFYQQYGLLSFFSTLGLYAGCILIGGWFARSMIWNNIKFLLEQT